MILGGVDVPDGVLSAHEEHQLVFFTGAGVSMAPPSGLPNFAGLAEQIADLTRAVERPGNARWKDKPDAYLGDLAFKGAEVHSLVRAAFEPSSSKPNSLHANLVRIANHGCFRIVTTNYDLHFETACEELDVRPDTYLAPALPLGDDFEGLVHLHGSAAGPASRLVVTDRDFGMAYLRDAWAARFLERMFRKYTVVFVGYSHQDVVMKYLGLALGSESDRYAFTDSTDDPGWERLGITPIRYSPENHHQSLADCLDSWARLSEMGLLDHEQRVRSLVAGPMQLSPDERAYLLDVLARPERSKFFFAAADDVAWLDWAADEHLLDVIFRPEAPVDELTAGKAAWFVRFVLDESTSQRAWDVLLSAGGRLSTTLWNPLALALFREAGPRPAHLRRWIHLLIQEVRDGCRHDFLGYVLHSSKWPEDRLEIVELLRFLLQPVPSRDRGYALIGHSVDIRPRGDEYELTRALEALRPHIGLIATEAVQIADVSLRRHLLLYEVLNSTAHDPFTWGRSAIQPHEQDKHRDAIDAVIDLGRDGLVHLVTHGSGGDDTLFHWLASDVSLLRRIGVHGLGAHAVLSADQKVGTLLDLHLLDDLRARQEVYEVLGRCAKTLSESMVDRVVSHAAQARDGSDQSDYPSFAVLEWLERHGAVTRRLADQLDDIRTSHPDYAPALNPGFTHWFEVGFVEPTPPTTVEDFHARVTADPEEALAFLLEYSGLSGIGPQTPGWSDAVTLLSMDVSEYPRDGVLLWALAETTKDLRDRIIAAWGKATEPDLLADIVRLLRSQDLASFLQPVGELFGSIADGNDCPWDSTPGIVELMDEFWAACVEATSPVQGGGWLTEAINHPAAHVLEFWFARFRRAWAASGDARHELRPEDTEFLSRIISDSSERGRVAVALTAARAHWFHSIDPGWFRQALLPCADWADPARASAFWWGFLSWGRFNADSLRAGLLDGLIETANHLQDFEYDQQWRWAALLATAALETGLREQLDWVQKLSASAPDSARIAFLDAVGDRLGDLPPEARQDAWSSWAAEYWTQRNVGVPVAPSLDESSALAQWVAFAPAAQIGRALDLATARPARLREHHAFPDGQFDRLVESHPADVGRLLIHLMSHTEPAGFHGDYWLTRLLTRLVAKPGQWRQLRDAALRLGIALP